MQTRMTETSAIDMLKEDHQKVKGLFEEFEQAKDSKSKQRIVNTVLLDLEVHAKLEEELFYPTVRPELGDEDLMDEALEEHHLVHVLIGELKKLKPSDERYDAKFTVLGECVKHHVKEEESEMLPKAAECDIDWDALNSNMMKRKEQLMSKFSSGSASRPSPSSRNGAAKKRPGIRRSKR